MVIFIMEGDILSSLSASLQNTKFEVCNQEIFVIIEVLHFMDSPDRLTTQCCLDYAGKSRENFGLKIWYASNCLRSPSLLRYHNQEAMP